MWEYIKKNRPLLIIFIIGVILRIYVSMAFSFEDFDSSLHLMNKLAISGGIDSNQPPMYPLFVRIMYSIFGDYNYKAVSIIQGLINSFVILLVYGIVSRLASHRAGLIAAAICAFYPHFIFSNLILDSTSLNIVLVCLLMLIMASKSNRKQKSILSALVIGLGVLVSPYIMFFIPGMFVVLERRLLFIAVLIAILVPSTVYNSITDKKFVPAYDIKTYEKHFAINRYARAGDWWYPVDTIYKNASALVNKGWKDKKASGTGSTNQATSPKSPNTRYDGSQGKRITEHERARSVRNRKYISSYTYLVIMFLGIVGLIKYYKREHREVVIPVAGFVLILIIFSETKLHHRALIEPMYIAYTSIYISLLRKPSIIRR